MAQPVVVLVVRSQGRAAPRLLVPEVLPAAALAALLEGLHAVLHAVLHVELLVARRGAAAQPVLVAAGGQRRCQRNPP